MTYPQGWKYEGAFENDKFSVEGKFSWSENHFYEGGFSNGKMTGEGVYQMEGGSRYDGHVGMFYPDSTNLGQGYKAQFDGRHLRYRQPQGGEGGKGY